ncbi:LysR family transcriptional regulator [Chromobacterium sp. S0633]|uniref:LysR family transcriptional regulator n=1 Tax=Chromobacterium sp. S0633 TaxID=2957805 RepID=UPI0020A0B884|nr:LysR family transcriptional regulator [Chromobacterium sp. S0633]MCP1291931.1 LysR family transcriptional regulator [Chromobacterium sp. S0633]
MWTYDEVTLKKLSVFLTFMRLGNMSRTAEALGQSPVSVHRALHSLEQALACPLFQRSGRRLVPLESAQALLLSAERALLELEDGVRQTREAAGFGSARLRVGALYSLTAGALPHILAGLKTRRPQLAVDLTLASNQELRQKLLDGALDAIVIVEREPSTGLACLSIPMFEDEICFAAPLNSPWSQFQSIDLATLRDLPFVTLHDTFATGQDFAQAFAIAGIQPNVVMRVADIFSLSNLVCGGIGYSLLPRRVALFGPQLQLIPLTAQYRRTQRIHLLMASKRERDPNLLALAAECRLYGRHHSPQISHSNTRV